MYDIQKNMIIVGDPGIRVQNDYYEKFFNQQQISPGRKNRNVFEFDYQRFLWAFILGISEKRRTPIVGKSTTPFKWSILDKRKEISSKIIGLTLLNEYWEDPNRLKIDFLKTISLEEGKTNELSKSIRIAIEEYANTGFELITQKDIEYPGYLEDGKHILEDISS